MSFDALLNRIITVFNLTGTDSSGRYGDEEEVWDPVGTEVAARIERIFQSESTAGEDQRKTLVRAYLPPDTVMDALAYIELDGERWRVLGEPNVVDGFVLPHHIEVVLERIEGA